ncbi:MAG: Cna B-type domain-containing protein, partial [Bowdeniella nasicola]|nr:Cna B-type domain-containing protein [Bowdeniella nasicola]
MTRQKPRAFSSAIATLILLLTSFLTLPAHAESVSDETQLRERIAAAAGNAVTLDLTGTIPLTQQLVIPEGADITLQPATVEGATLTATGRPRSMIKVEEGATLTLNGNGAGKITVTAAGGAIRVLDVAGTVTMNDGLLTGMVGDPTDAELPGREFRAAVNVFGAGNMTMNGGAIAENDIGAGGSNIQETAANLAVFTGGTFTLNGGEIRDGKSYPRDWVLYATGGVGLFKKANFTMTGGKITGNEGGAAGGISIHAGNVYWDEEDDRERWASDDLGVNVRIEGGEITNNTAYYYGGGIGGWGKFDITMTGGTIAKNTAPYGGGVHVQDYYVSGDFDEGVGAWKPDPGQALGYSIDEWKQIVPASFTMTGGTISDNTADHSGGGINVVSDSVTLLGGVIERNEVLGGSILNKRKMGGGVYVSTQPYTLRMSNVLFDSNSADEGAAIWNCPTGETRLHITDGGAFADNQARRYGRDVQVTPFGAGEDNPPRHFNLPTRQLGGGSLDWYLDGYDDRKPIFNEDWNTVRFDDKNPGKGTKVDITDLAKNPRYIGTAAHAPFGADQPRSLAKLHIRDNYAFLGGGVGTNGNVDIGNGEEELTELKVKKIWDGDNPPASLEVELKANDSPIDKVTLNAENNWQHVFTELPKKANGKAIEYSIAETELEGWAGTVSDPVNGTDLPDTIDEDDPATITITNSELVQLKVLKDWKAAGHELPESIEATLLANGEKVATATLNAENNWQHVFTELPKK